MAKCKQVAMHKHAYAYNLNFPFVSFRSKETSHVRVHKVEKKHQKNITTKRHKYVNSVCALSPDWFVSTGLKLWDNMDEILEFSDQKLEEEEANDASLKLIRRLSTLEEVRF